MNKWCIDSAVNAVCCVFFLGHLANATVLSDARNSAPLCTIHHAAFLVKFFDFRLDSRAETWLENRAFSIDFQHELKKSRTICPCFHSRDPAGLRSTSADILSMRFDWIVAALRRLGWQIGPPSLPAPGCRVFLGYSKRPFLPSFQQKMVLSGPP